MHARRRRSTAVMRGVFGPGAHDGGEHDGPPHDELRLEGGALPAPERRARAEGAVPLAEDLGGGPQKRPEYERLRSAAGGQGTVPLASGREDRRRLQRRQRRDGRNVVSQGSAGTAHQGLPGGEVKRGRAAGGPREAHGVRAVGSRREQHGDVALLDPSERRQGP